MNANQAGTNQPDDLFRRFSAAKKRAAGAADADADAAQCHACIDYNHRMASLSPQNVPESPPEILGSPFQQFFCKPRSTDVGSKHPGD
jgi:hypothetical protein